MHASVFIGKTGSNLDRSKLRKLCYLAKYYFAIIKKRTVPSCFQACWQTIFWKLRRTENQTSVKSYDGAYDLWQRHHDDAFHTGNTKAAGICYDYREQDGLRYENGSLTVTTFSRTMGRFATKCFITLLPRYQLWSSVFTVYLFGRSQSHRERLEKRKNRRLGKDRKMTNNADLPEKSLICGNRIYS